MSLEPEIEGDGSDMENSLLIKIGSAAEIYGPIKTISHGWRPYSEMPRIRWDGHGYVLQSGERPISEFHPPESNDMGPPEMDLWLQELTEDSAQLATDDRR
ncbi:hypothetical protein G6011_04762 [Alternaria panax]|uniref:Uncharacterized protein n=1 Tax=Alternaria panax TaxID=48097 RepID=A0AAD4IH44_9PLEO|nr:hypothetical protein G6011_04762 [Alternaria panax]